MRMTVFQLVVFQNIEAASEVMESVMCVDCNVQFHCF